MRQGVAMRIFPVAGRDRWLAGIGPAALLALAVLSITGYVAALPAAYHRAESLDPSLVDRPELMRAGLAAWGLSTGTFAIAWVTGVTVVAAVFIGVGVLIAVRRPGDRTALLFAAVLVCFGTIWPNTVPAPDWPPALTAATEALAIIGFVGFFGLLFYFPDGRFVPRWTGWAFAALAGHVVVSETLLAYQVRIPAALDLALVVAWVVAGIWAQVHRYRQVSTSAQRQQTKWVAGALVVAVGGFAIVALLGRLQAFAAPRGAVVYAVLTMFVFGALFCLVPVAVARAVLRLRLWDIDPLFNRTLVYGGLTVILTAIYAGLVVWIGRIVVVRGYPIASILAAGAVAVLFEPLRRRMQSWANRLTYGQRDDPYAALTALARRLEQAAEPQVVLPVLAESVRLAIRSPYAAITAPDGDVMAASGRPAPDAFAVPLTHGGEALGELLIAPRAPGEGFDDRDRRLLQDLAGQTASALHTVRLQQHAAGLAAQLQTSRERLVAAREEERRRVRRELHDGLGPALAAQAMQVEAAHGLLRRQPDRAESLLEEVLARSADAVEEVRRIARGLRPPALDELGLAGAVQQAAADLSPGVRVRVITADLPVLPAAVEVVAYAIVREALTNVVRHAAASAAEVCIAADGPMLKLEIVDDGRGLAGSPPGVGMVSMRERAQELGGRCTVTAGPTGGVLIAAQLPLNPEGANGTD
jgi:signal transduction histidine kinase